MGYSHCSIRLLQLLANDNHFKTEHRVWNTLALIFEKKKRMHIYIVVSLEMSQGKMLHSSWQVKLLLFETLKEMTKLCSQLNMNCSRRAGGSGTHISALTYGGGGGGFLWTVFRKAHLQFRHGALQAEGEEELKCTALHAKHALHLY